MKHKIRTLIFLFVISFFDCAKIDTSCNAIDATCNPLYSLILYSIESKHYFVAVSANGPFYSHDGEDWTASEDTFALKKITFGNGIFVALPDFATATVVYYSMDGGKSWNQSNPFAAARIGGIAFNGTNFVVTGDDGGTSTGYCRYSSDAIVWKNCALTSSASAGNEYSAIAADRTTGNMSVSPQVGAVQRVSIDKGVTWLPAGSNPTWAKSDLEYITTNAGNTYLGIVSLVIVDDIEYSVDGGISTVWTNVDIMGAGRNLFSIANGFNRVVIVGENGGMNSIWYNTDHTDTTLWPVVSGLSGVGSLRAATFGNDRFVVAGDNSQAYYSDDGVDWHPSKITQSTISFLDIAYGEIK